MDQKAKIIKLEYLEFSRRAEADAHQVIYRREFSNFYLYVVNNTTEKAARFESVYITNKPLFNTVKIGTNVSFSTIIKTIQVLKELNN